jgi:hypothetical protein
MVRWFALATLLLALAVAFANATDASGSSSVEAAPSTGLEALKLALLGFVLVLVGARVRAIARRRASARYAYLAPQAGGPEPQLEPDGLPHAAPTGLLPSTATAKRQAHRRETQRPG